MRWVTRAHVHVDRVACPWLISRFVDNEAEFVFVARDMVAPTAWTATPTRPGSKLWLRGSP
jgi:hypothetical protein